MRLLSAIARRLRPARTAHAYELNHDITRTYVPDSGASTVTDTKNLPVPLGHTFVKTNPATGQKRTYKFVLVEDAALVLGDLVCYTTDDNGYEVTRDRAGGTSDNSQPAGLAIKAIPDGNCGWIQIGGPSDVDVVTDGGIAAGEGVIAHATNDGEADSANFAAAADPSTNPYAMFGQALDADTSTTLPAGKLFLACRGAGVDSE